MIRRFSRLILYWTGSFIFSIWDGDRVTRRNGVKEIKKSSKLAWPVRGKNCRRNCQDCGLPSLNHLAKQGFTTGTKCLVRNASMKVYIDYNATPDAREFF